MQRRKAHDVLSSSLGVAPSPDRASQDSGKQVAKVGVPVSVIHHLLGYPSLGLLPSGPPGQGSTADEGRGAFIEVEVETRQGYVYAGKLVELDAHYNVTLHEATVCRQRPCDVERSLRQEHWRQQQRLMLGVMNADVPLSALGVDVEGERADSATRMRFVGTTLIRSSSLLMIRFIGDGAVVGLTDKSVERPSITSEGGTSRRKIHTESSPRPSLRRAFVEAATAAKKAIEQERRKNRLERQKRKMAAKGESARKK